MVLMVLVGFREYLEQVELRVKVVQMELLVKQVLQVNQEHREQVVSQVLQVRLVLQV